MEVSQIFTTLVMVILTGGMAYLIGDLHGYLRGMEKAKEIYEEKRI
tara:strand:- start:225 stop:362 length:138 start_codon:yes stop_codon:yes gene_type:complete